MQTNKNLQTMLFIDTHCHLHEEVFENDIDEIIERMKIMGITKFLTIGTSPEDCERALKLRDKYPDMCTVSLALDPTDTQKYVGDLAKVESDFTKIEKLARENDPTAIGETGLDKNWKVGAEFKEQFTPETLEIQHLLFEKHIALAKELKKPLVIHQRDVLTQTLKTLKDNDFIGSEDGKKLGVFHSFTGDITDAQRIIEAGFYLGINGIVTFNNASKLQGAVRLLDSKHILYETDAPFLSPEPNRGQRNDPTSIPLIAEFIDSLQEKEISEAVLHNSKEFLNLF